MSDPLDRNGLQAGISEYDLLKAPCGGIASVGGLDIGLQQGTDGGDTLEESAGDSHGILLELIVALFRAADPKADGDGRFKLRGNLIDDLLRRFGKFFRGDGLVGEETGKEQVKKIVAERENGLLGGQVGAVDVIDPSALPIGFEDWLEQVLPGVHLTEISDFR